MITRLWRASAERDRRDAYPEHFRRHVVPELRAVAGFLGADLLSRDTADTVEFTVLTRWESMDAIRRFAGEDPERAVVDPEAAAVLRRFDRRVTHDEIVEHVEPQRPHPSGID
jgi:heme-degrading monooxygenase HmoA